MKLLLLPPLLLLTSLLFSQMKIETPHSNTSRYLELGMPYMQHYEPKDYNGRPDNQALVQGDNGLMYIGNSKGVMEFDGIDWRMIQLPNKGVIRTLVKIESGVIFVGGFDELGYLKPDSLGATSFQSIISKLDSIYRNFNYLNGSFTIKDEVYFWSDKHLFQWANNEFKIWSPKNGIIRASEVNGIIYLQEKENGLFRLIQNEWEAVIPMEYKIRDILPFDKDTILLTTWENGLFFLRDKELIPFSTQIDSYLREHQIMKSKIMPNGWITIGTYSGGLSILDQKGNLVYQFDKTTGLLNNLVINHDLDNQGGLWLGLYHGISRIELFSPVTIFDERLGISSFVNHITRYNGKLFAASTQGVLSLSSDDGMNGKSFKKLDGPQRAFYLLEFGQSLLLECDNGLFIYDKGIIKQLNERPGRALLRSKKDSTLIFTGLSTGLGIMKKENGFWNDLGQIENIEDDICEIIEMEDGKLWMESQIDGVWLVDFYKGDSLNISTPEIRRFKANEELPAGWLFLHAINGKAVFEIEGKIYSYHQEKDSIIHDESFGLPFGFKGDIVPKIQDKNGNLWISAQLLGLEDEDKQRTVSIPQSDGSYKVKHINDKRITHQAKKALFPDGLDVLWYGGVDGIIRQDLKQEVPKIHNFKALIRKISINKDSLIYGGTKTSTEVINWNYDNDLVRFEYAAPSYNEISQNKYQYYLEGYDTQWSDWTEESKKDYTKVPEGDYVFRVKAKNIYQQLSQEDSYAFTIYPPWYRTSWAYFVYLLLFSGLSYVILQWRSYQLKAKNIALEKLISIRTSEVQHQANQLKIQAQKLLELDKAKSRFFANISHEFRTPLTLIKGPIEHLEQNFEEKMSMDTVKMIRRSSNRLLNMVNQLLDLSKIDEGSLKLAPTEGDVYKCLRAATSSFNSHAAQRNMDYRVEIPPTMLWASFDRDKLENIVYNLLGNAFKFSGDGSKISFFAEYTVYGLQIRVSDTGKGIPTEKLPFIFDRFFQADNSNTRDKGGSGIGLSLSKDLVELMDGTITVSSEEGKGTYFTLQLPIQEIKTRQKNTVGKSAQLEKYITKKPFALTTRDQRNLPSILLVEDNSDMRYFITVQLIKFYKVIASINGEEGFQKALASAPDLIITDLMMPKMDGIELCKKLKSDVHTSHIPVIMLTAKAGIENKIEGLETGADDYLTKPFDANELLIRTKNLIVQRQKLRELYSNREVQVDPKKITVTSIDQKFLEQVLELLEVNFSDPNFSVPQMQKSLAMSKTQLHRKLKALTNEAPGELLRNFRLKRAAQLLLQKADNVTQIAYQVGFNNLSYFAKCFKELYGVTPSSY